MEKEIEKQIKFHRDQITLLNEKIEESSKQSFGGLIHKYYSLAASSMFYSKNIEYTISPERVCISGIRIVGGIDYVNSFQIELDSHEDFDIDYLPKEITKEEFLSIEKKWRDEFENVLFKEKE